MSHYRGSYSVNIVDNQKERNRLDQNGLQLKRENEANLAKIKQLTADLQAAQDEMHNQAKLISRLRSQIEQIKNEKQDAERFRDQLEADLVKFEQEANDRLRQLQSQGDKLNREQEKNAQLEEERDGLLQQLDQLERDLASVKKSQQEQNDAQEQIKVKLILACKQLLINNLATEENGPRVEKCRVRNKSGSDSASI